MKTLIAIILITVTTTASGVDLVELKASAARMEAKSGDFAFRIDYESEYEAKLGDTKGNILQQRIVRFYDSDKFIGSYFYWQEVGSGLSSATISSDLLVKPDHFTHVRITDRFYDVNWRDGRWSEEELSKWFAQTWHLFNSTTPGKQGGYYLCEIDDIPRMDGYLKGSGFTLFTVLTHTFTLTHTEQSRSNPKADQAGKEQPSSRPESKSEGSVKPQPEAEGRSR